MPEVLETALRHVPGSGPVTLECLSAGDVNETWRVTRDGIDHAMRLARPAAPDFGLDRQWECRVLRTVAAAGLAPQVECCAPEAGVLVLRFVHGVRWTPAQARGPGKLERMAHLIRRIQACTAPAHARCMSPQDWIEHYGAKPDASGAPLRSDRRVRALGPVLDAQRAALARLAPGETVLCHGDLHVDNLIDAPDGPLLIDWEYAHLADALWDVAGWSANNELAPTQMRRLLREYLGGAPQPAAARRLVILRWMYEYLCLQWMLLTLTRTPASGSAAADREASACALAERLERGGEWFEA